MFIITILLKVSFFLSHAWESIFGAYKAGRKWTIILDQCRAKHADNFILPKAFGKSKLWDH